MSTFKAGDLNVWGVAPMGKMPMGIASFELMKDKNQYDSQDTTETNCDLTARCRNCTWYTGMPGTKPHQIMCAVNPKFKPSLAELRKARGSRPDALHDCPDFKKAPNPVFGGFSHRSYSFEFDS